MNFAILAQALADEGAEFVVIGGWAAIAHGSAYVTGDLDICFARDRANLERIVRALRPYHPPLRDFPPSLPFIWDTATLNNGTVFTLQTDHGIIDLLAEVSGVGSYAEALSKSELSELFDRELRVLDLPALIAAKRAAGRPKDLNLLPELESLLEAEQADDPADR